MLNQNMIILVIIFEKNEIHKLKDPFTVSFSMSTQLVVKETFKKNCALIWQLFWLKGNPLDPVIAHHYMCINY